MIPLVLAQESEAVRLMSRNQSLSEGTTFRGLGDRSWPASTWAKAPGSNLGFYPSHSPHSAGPEDRESLLPETR